MAYTTTGQGNTCPFTENLGNHPPVVNAGPAYTIPNQTPFKLVGSATDPDGDALTYNWEEFDLGAAAPPNTDDGTRPIFRSFNPVTVPYRYLPRLTDILSNTLTFGEAFPTTNRTLKFRLTARDNHADVGGVDYAQVALTVTTSSGPFLVTQPNTAVTWPATSSQTVTWDVANTTAAPVSCANVDISLSVDGGNSFPFALATNTANDGTEQITVPNIGTGAARVMVGCSNNIFLDISNADFTITGGPTPTSTTAPSSTSTATPADTATATITPGGPTLTPTNTSTPQPTATIACDTVTYHTVNSTATIIPATNDTGNHCDDCTTNITLPFQITVYGALYNIARVNSNGNIQFASDTGNNGVDEGCVPVAGGDGDYLSTVFLNNTDLRTDESPDTHGVFTDVIGTAPNRQFIVRWLTTYYDSPGDAEFEIVFTENSTQFDVIYGNILDNGLSAASGIQRNMQEYTSYSCLQGILTNGLKVTYMQVSCGTATPTVVGTNTATTTAVVSVTATAAVSATATPTACTLEFADVLPGNTFYPFIKCLACRNIINGYPCGGTGEPCNPNSDPYFRPSNPVSRGQLAKVVSQSAGFNDPVSGQTFEDVLPGTTFYTYTERLASRSVMGGYPCGVDPSEPCELPGNRPYFRPSASATRGQLTKIVSNAAGFNDPDPATFTFTDVPPGSTFHVYVERLLLNRPGVMNGYPCGIDPTEPCDSQSRPYFRPNATLSRGQTSKIVANTFFPNCQTPQQPAKK
ncbi:MAG: S-layer homology domain-containing protein [Chloroflexota bacterium]